jgi:hypothetical protein
LFWKPPVIMKIVPKAVYDMLLEKIDQWEGRKAATAVLCCSVETIFELISVFKEASRYLINYISFSPSSLKFSKKVPSDWGLHKNTHLVTQSLKGTSDSGQGNWGMPSRTNTK